MTLFSLYCVLVVSHCNRFFLRTGSRSVRGGREAKQISSLLPFFFARSLRLDGGILSVKGIPDSGGRSKGDPPPWRCRSSRTRHGAEPDVSDPVPTPVREPPPRRARALSGHRAEQDLESCPTSPFFGGRRAGGASPPGLCAESGPLDPSPISLDTACVYGSRTLMSHCRARPTLTAPTPTRSWLVNRERHTARRREPSWTTR